MIAAFTRTQDVVSELFMFVMKCPHCGHCHERRVTSEEIEHKGELPAVAEARVHAAAGCACWRCLMRRGNQRKRLQQRRLKEA